MNAAIKQALCKKFDPVDVWIEDTEGFNYRLVFEAARIFEKTHRQREARAIRYVDIVFTVLPNDDICIVAQAQNREGTRIDCANPDSLDKLERFIQRNCFDLYIQSYKEAENT